MKPFNEFTDADNAKFAVCVFLLMLLLAFAASRLIPDTRTPEEKALPESRRI